MENNAHGRFATIYECYKKDDLPDKQNEKTAQSSSNGLITIARLARAHGISLRTLRFYQDKGLLAPARRGKQRLFGPEDCERLALILQGKRLGFTLIEVRQMLAAWQPDAGMPLPIGRKKCVEQINLLERQRHEIGTAIAELRQIYNRMFTAGDTMAEDR